MSEQEMEPGRETTTVKPSGTPRRVKVILGISLALNLLIVGVIVGGVASHRDRGRGPQFDHVSAPMTFALSREDRRMIGRKIRDEYKPHRASRAEFRAEFAKVIAALRATPFDPEVVRDSLDHQMKSVDQRQELGRDMLIRHLAAMTPEARAQYADRLGAALERGHKGGHRPRNHD